MMYSGSSRKRTLTAESNYDQIHLPSFIEIGKKYKLTVTKTAETEKDSLGLSALHFTFKPANIDTSIPGKLHSSPDRVEAAISLGRHKKEQIDTYRGLIDNSEKLFALAFNPDEDSFQLQKLDLVVNQLKLREEIIG